MSGGQPLTINPEGLVTSIGVKWDLGLLQEEVEKLNTLLQDPQPEMLTWKEMILKQSKRVVTLLKDCGLDPGK
jgi:hypothetical protein